jgi:hypothetical protein
MLYGSVANLRIVSVDAATVEGARRPSGSIHRYAGRPGHHLVDDAAQVLLVNERGVDPCDPAETPHVNAVGPIDQDLADAGVAQQWLE